LVKPCGVVTPNLAVQNAIIFGAGIVDEGDPEFDDAGDDASVFDDVEQF